LGVIPVSRLKYLQKKAGLAKFISSAIRSWKSRTCPLNAEGICPQLPSHDDAHAVVIDKKRRFLLNGEPEDVGNLTI